MPGFASRAATQSPSKKSRIAHWGGLVRPDRTPSMENAVRGPASTCRDPWNQQGGRGRPDRALGGRGQPARRSLRRRLGPDRALIRRKGNAAPAAAGRPPCEALWTSSQKARPRAPRAPSRRMRRLRRTRDHQADDGNSTSETTAGPREPLTGAARPELLEAVLPVPASGDS